MNIFMTGLPYAGSNIIVTLLQQNPKFGVYYDIPLFQMTNNIVDDSQIDEDSKFKKIEDLFSTYYEHEHNINIDYKWLYTLSVVNKLGAKVICCVRDISEILNEYEHEFVKNSSQQSDDSNVNLRCQGHMNGILGDRYNSVKPIINYDFPDIMLIEHNFLINNLESTIENIYKFLDIPLFEHDYTKIDLTKEQSPLILPPDIIQQY